MTFSPIKKVKVNTLISLTMLVILAVIYTIVKLYLLPDVIWQGVFFVLAIILCELMVKYFLPIYTYSFDNDRFLINKTLGRKTVTVCDIDTDKIVALYSRDEYKKQELYAPKSVYNYNGNVVPTSCRVLIFKYSDCTEAVVFEPSIEMQNFIHARIESR